jgi:RNA-directed DNA polymerase
MQLMEMIVSRENMMAALQRVVSNKGAAGVDEMTVGQLKRHLVEHWPRIKEELLTDRYEPAPVRGVEIPKPGGKGKRLLGIPTVLDRLIQQAMHQVLMSIFDPDFSNSSYGFRPERSAHDAVLAARSHVAAGYRFVVDLDLEKFFDRVNHDVLMARVAHKVSDKQVLRLIRRFLQAGLMMGGTATARSEGTPQGGPLSPLLSNILLDDLDKELERRGHRFCRYADDCNVYVRSMRAGQRVMASLTTFLEERLKLKVNAAKSAVDQPKNRTFLGYSMTGHREPRLRVAATSALRLRSKLRKRLFRAGRGRHLGVTVKDLAPILRGWTAYFRLAEVKGTFEELDEWLRRRLRCILWRQWKTSTTRAKSLMQRGVSQERSRAAAYNGRGPWRNAGTSQMHYAFRNTFFDKLGLISLRKEHRRLNNTA